jgi:hypothetical protein
MRCPPGERLEVASAWINSWRNENIQGLFRLRSALDRADIPDAQVIAGELGKLTGQRFPALTKVLKILSEGIDSTPT